MGESVIGAILFQIVFDTAAMDFYTVPGLCLALDEVDPSPQFLPYCVCSTFRSFHRKSRTQASSTSDIFIKLLIVQWICI